jgi:hypothetical protein
MELVVLLVAGVCVAHLVYGCVIVATNAFFRIFRRM